MCNMDTDWDNFYELLRGEAAEFRAGDVVIREDGSEGVVSCVNEDMYVELMGDMGYYSPFILRRRDERGH